MHDEMLAEWIAFRLTPDTRHWWALWAREEQRRGRLFTGGKGEQA